MNALITERTPLVIAAEINTIKRQTENILLTNAIEIGRRLKEAKELVRHGEWGKWLAESVSYSQSTADKLMRICEEYGPKVLASPDGDGSSNSATLRNLTHSQALILLGVPEEKREQFIAENDVENMSARELRQAVKEKNQAVEEKNQAAAERDQALQENEGLKEDLKLKDSKISQLTDQAKNLENQVEEYKQKYQAEQEKITQKQREPEADKEKIPSSRKIAELENELQTTKTKASVMKADAQFTIHRDIMIKAYEELQKALTALARTDPEMKEKYRETARKMLENMANALKEWPPVVKTNFPVNRPH